MAKENDYLASIGQDDDDMKGPESKAAEPATFREQGTRSDLAIGGISGPNRSESGPERRTTFIGACSRKKTLSRTKPAVLYCGKYAPDSETPEMNQQSLTIQQAVDLAIQHHAAGKLSEAEGIYREILQLQPDNPLVLHYLGVVAHQRDDNDQAVALIGKALAIEPGYAEAYSNLGLALKAQGELEEAIASYDKAIDLNPEFIAAYNNLGIALHEQGKFDEAVTAYEKAISLNPQHAISYNNLGNALKDKGRLDEAIESYRKSLSLNPNGADCYFNIGNAFKAQERHADAIASYRAAIEIKPSYAEAYNNLGIALHEQHSYDEAISSYRKSLSIDPNFTDVYGNLALTLHTAGRSDEAFEQYSKGLQLRRGENIVTPHHRSFRFTTSAKMKHDIEQFCYLAALGQDTNPFESHAETYRKISSEIAWPEQNDHAVALPDDHLSQLEETYNRIVHVVEAPRISGGALNRSLDIEKITADYFCEGFEMTSFDNLLSPAALKSLRRFLLCSTIWFDFDYKGGYLGAYLKDGLACPLLLQISDELRKTFPKIFKNHQLTQLWSYKYDSQLSGINVHADFAAVNVNFWVTPDTANLNPNSGGLIVYNTEAPADWNFESYNKDDAKIRQHIRDNEGATSIVPYKENRIVLFNSNLFHETDSFTFKEGYENRRINITMLFGKREN